MIRLENVNKYFNKGKKNEIHVIKGTTISFDETGLVALLGPSGCGKTSLLNAMGGLDRVQSGKIMIGNEELTGRSSSKIDEIRSRNIGYIFQNYYLVDDMTVFNNVAMVLKMNDVRSKSEIETKVNYALEMVGMYRYRNRYADMLSGGERQRVGIARAIVKDPEIIIADEPTGNLDSKNTIEVMNIIKAISRRRLVILVTHEEELANFYAGRIIRIKDGAIISDEENVKDSDLDYRIDNKIYLKDIADKQEFTGGDHDVRVYAEPGRKIDLDIVIRGDNIYIKNNDETGRIEVVDEASGVEMIDDHYRGMTQEDFLSHRFESKKLALRKAPRYTSIISARQMLTKGFSKIAAYKPLKKILLLGFFISAMFIMFALSNIFGVLDIHDSDFVKTNKDYLKVKTKKLTTDEYLSYQGVDEIEYVIPGDATVNLRMPYDDFLQTNGSDGVLTGSLSSVGTITKEDLTYGRMPKNKKEIVVDKLVIKNMQKGGTAKQAGLGKVGDFLGKTIDLDEQNEFNIVGVTDDEEPCIYVDPSLFLTFVAKSMSSDQAEMMNEDGNYYDDWMMDDDYGDEGDDATSGKLVDFNEYDFKGGVEPKKDYEVVVSDEFKDQLKLGKTIDRKVNGHKLKVVGYYQASGNGETPIMLVNTPTMMYSVIESKTNLMVYGKDKEALKAQLEENGASVEDPYDKARKKYVGRKEKSMRSAIITAAIILLISFIEIFLIMRASFLSRIKEVGVYRAIGVKKKDIYKMFLGEVIAITTVAGVPGFAFASYILYKMSGNEILGGDYLINPCIMLMGIILIFALNIIFGLLPVARTLRQVPAEILARTDVD